MKILDLDKTIKEIEKLKQQNLKIILVGGCFDVIHPGHLRFLEKAKRAGDILIVALEPDEKVRELKGEGRPVNNQKKRANELAKFSSVDMVLLLPYLKNDKDYFYLVESIKPNIIATTEDDPKIELKKKQAEAGGGKIEIVIPRLKEYSTSKLVKTSNSQ